MFFVQNHENLREINVFALRTHMEAQGGPGEPWGYPRVAFGGPESLLRRPGRPERTLKGPLGGQWPPLGQTSIYTNSRSTASLRLYLYEPVASSGGPFQARFDIFRALPLVGVVEL